MTNVPPPIEGDPEDVQRGNFWGWLRDHKNGALHAELSEALAEVSLASMEHGKVGTLTLKISVKPTKDGSTVYVADDLSVNPAKADRGVAIMFANEDGSLTRHNPNQMSMPMRVVKELSNGEPVIIETDTGVVKEIAQ